MVGQWICRSAVTIGIIILTYISNILPCVYRVYCEYCIHCVQCLHCVHCVYSMYCVYCVYQQPLPFMVGQWISRSAVTIGTIILIYISNILSCVHYVVLCVHCVEQSQKSLYFQYRDFWPGSWLLWTERNLWTDLSTFLSINPKMAKNIFYNGLL